MNTRRDFFKSAAAVGFLGATGMPLRAAIISPPVSPETSDDRSYWVSIAEKLAHPVLDNLARRELRKNMPVESLPRAGRELYSHLEAFGRLLCGLAPWFAATGLDVAERTAQQTLLKQAQLALDAATDPTSPDFMNFSNGGQPLVDAAFLAQAILRAPTALWAPLEPRVRKQIIAAFESSRKIATPDHNNWVLFAAMIEAALLEFGEPTMEERLESCVRKMLGWYVGDGAYGDGDFFHFDYYNSYVIHPMLLDVLATLQRHDARFQVVYTVVLNRARRYAEIQERLIAPDATFPVLGRSITYRFGAFQLLAQIALLHALPGILPPAQVRCALSAVYRKMSEATGMFDDKGWLQIGFFGHQVPLAENYISTGSLYLCATGLLPLGLPPSDPFWSGPATRWTSQKIWAGEPLPADHALTDVRVVEVPTLNRAQASLPEPKPIPYVRQQSLGLRR